MKYAIYKYECGYCTNTFKTLRNDELKNVMIQCPNCENFLKKNSFIDVEIEDHETVQEN